MKGAEAKERMVGQVDWRLMCSVRNARVTPHVSLSILCFQHNLPELSSLLYCVVLYTHTHTRALCCTVIYNISKYIYIFICSYINIYKMKYIYFIYIDEIYII